MKNWITPLIVLVGLLVYLVSLRGNAPGPETKETFARAATQFEEGNYSQAEESYRALIADGKKSSAIYYNLALTQDALEKPGQAILNLEKAALLDPGSSKISSKLAELRKNNGSTGTAEPAFWQTIPPRWLAVAGALAVLVLTLLPLSRLLKIPHAPAAITAVVCLPIISACAYALYDYDQRKSNRAIIVSSDTSLRMSPFDDAESLQALAPGQTVKTVEEKNHEDFRLVETENGRTGWVRATEVGNITDW